MPADGGAAVVGAGFSRPGGAWILEATPPDAIFTPEKVSDEHRLMVRTTREFMDNEVAPHLEALEAKDWTRARQMLRRAGELGLLGINVPEVHGGLDLDKAAALVVSEQIAFPASFASLYGAHANLCILPLVMFGTEEQKQRYLPRLVTAELVGAYALSEAGSGSDALAARTRATQQADGSWSLTGEKMWITNGGFADLFIVFARAEGEAFTAFIVERGFSGVRSGAEEHKMGLHGSSTTPLILQDVRVPAGNVLGEVGKGHKVALNTLNFGRYELGAMCAGGCRLAIGDAARYAAERRQFDRPIAEFGAIRHKLGEMVARTYAAESLMYRTAGLIDEAIAAGASAAAAFEEYAVECSIAKVFGSEVLDFVVDESVQIHGGNGFVRDYPAERAYRDARVNRIFEGTNEINRLLITGMLARRAVKGTLPLIAAATRLQDEILNPAWGPASAGPILDEEEPLAAETRTVGAFRHVTLMVLGTAMQTYGTKLQDEQEVLACCADILIELFAADSAVLRAMAIPALPPEGGSHARAQHLAAARLFTADSAMRVDMAARTALAAMAEGDTLRTLLAALRRLLKPVPVNTVALRRELADAAVAGGRYSLSW